MEISVVIPVYGCPEALPELHRRLVASVGGITGDFEIILVDDGCPQGSWAQIERLCEADARVVGLRLSRNFGQSRAITAGLDRSRGDWVVVMDCDLQDRPEAIPALYQKAQEGYDVVFARRAGRKDTAVTKFLSRAFYRVYDWFSDTVTDSGIGNFSIARRAVIDSFCQMREQNRDYQIFIRWLGFRQTAIDAPADARFAGESSYSLGKKLALAFEIVTAQSNKPLRFSVGVGFAVAFAALLYIVYLVLVWLFVGDAPEGWTTVVASIYLMGGVLLGAIGVAGLYIGNIFNETKARPLYVVAEARNADAPAREGGAR